MDWFPLIVLFGLFHFAAGQNVRKIPMTGVTASQSFTYYGNRVGYGPERAIDGNPDQRFNRGSCSHTAAGHSFVWWQLYLRQSYDISRIVIYYRNDTNLQTERLKGFQIYVSESHDIYGRRQYNPKQRNLCYADSGIENPPAFLNVSCAKTMRGSYVTIYNERRNFEAFLELCEVEVYGCLAGTCNVPCSDRCNNCDTATGVCKECKDGFYGTICENNCSSECRNNVCERDSGHCKDCNPSHYGRNCSLNCPNCIDGVCNIENGVCTHGCNRNFYGNQCNDQCSESCKDRVCFRNGICRTCNDGFYGERCQRSCPRGCKNNICQRERGHCNKCNSLRYGRNCSLNCPNCQGGVCNIESGVCTRGCNRNFYGRQCNDQCSESCKDGVCFRNGTCRTCNDGFYGERCQGSCPRGCKNNVCKIDSGDCNQCNLFHYGRDCSFNCRNCLYGDCNIESGVCNHGCNKSFYGRQCNDQCSENCKDGVCFRDGNCKECNPFRYGRECTLNCSNCNEGVCNKDHGSCLKGCKSTFYGNLCNDQCSEKCKDRLCLNSGRCRDCYLGTYGDFCEQKCPIGCMNANCSRNGKCNGACVKGYHGVACDKTCSLNCSPKGCHKHSAHCHECKDSLYGPYCAEQCPSNCHSKACNKTTGICGTCFNGYYGSYCNETCGSGCKDEVCIQMTGYCSLGCKDGFLGLTCEEKCGEYRYGKNCMHRCGHCMNNKTCHFINGSCLNGCDDTWIGDKCDKELLQFVADTNNLLVIAGSVVGITIIIIVIAVILTIFLHKRRKTTTSTGENIELDTLGSKAGGEVSNSKKAPTQTRNRNSVKVSVNREKLYVNMQDLTLNTRQHEIQSNAAIASDTRMNDESSDAVYSNIDISGIDVLGLEKEILKKKSENEFDLEYKKFPHDAVFPSTIAALPENKSLNRFLTTFPYDHSRVVLTDLSGSDYINASYIDGVTDGRSYIATQGPKQNTITDFWRMVWQVKSGNIVMLTNLVENMKSKCVQYWPDSSKPIDAGRLTVTLIHEMEFTFYVSRTFVVRDKQTTECRNVEQLHLISWPDHGVPDITELVTFHRRFLFKENVQPGPPIVHCSAGIGRTGTFIALNALYLHGLATGKIDVFKYVMSMRNNRMNMVQTKDQYVILHEALVEQFKYDKTTISTHLFLNFWSKEKKMPLKKRKTKEEFEMLQAGKPKYSSNDFASGHNSENKTKSRKGNALPVEKYRVFLMSFDSSRTNYINAVMLQSVTQRYGYIATHYPLQSTVCDFWCMIYDQRSEEIVALNDQDKDYTTWYPSTHEVMNCGKFAIKRSSQSTEYNDVRETHFKLTKKEANEERTVKLFELLCWPCHASVPTCKSSFLHLLKVTEQLNNDGEVRGPITAVCRDGASGCGLFCALSNILQSQIFYEEVNMFSTISQLQKRRPEFINNYEQYQFCHEIVEESLGTTSIYNNI